MWHQRTSGRAEAACVGCVTSAEHGSAGSIVVILAETSASRAKAWRCINNRLVDASGWKGKMQVDLPELVLLFEAPKPPKPED